MTGSEHLQPSVLVLTYSDEALVNFAARIFGQLSNDRRKSGGEMHLRLVLDKATWKRNRLEDLGKRKAPIFELGQRCEDPHEADHVGIVPAEIFRLEIFAERPP